MHGLETDREDAFGFGDCLNHLPPALGLPMLERVIDTGQCHLLVTAEIARHSRRAEIVKPIADAAGAGPVKLYLDLGLCVR